MAKGADEKALIVKQILEQFNGAFEYGKEIRIPVNDVQIKVTLTCAKDIVEQGGDSVVPGAATKVKATTEVPMGSEPVFEEKEFIPPTDEELTAVSAFMAAIKGEF